MTNILCSVCDCEIFEDKSKLNKYLATSHKENDMTIYKNYVIKDVNLCDIDDILDHYVCINNKKFNPYFIKCDFNITFNNNHTSNIETHLAFNNEAYKINQELLIYLDSMKSEGYNLININHITINTYNDRCNMTYEYYTHRSLNPIEIKLNKINSKDSKLLDNIKHLLIKKYSHISFNI